MALLRRLEKRVLVALPDAAGRQEMIEKHLSSRCDPSLDFQDIARRTEGFSGSDLKLLSKEIAMKPVRRLMRRLEELEGAGQAIPLSQGAIQAEIDADPVGMQDVDEALSATRPSAQKYTEKYERWQRDYGAV